MWPSAVCTLASPATLLSSHSPLKLQHAQLILLRIRADWSWHSDFACVWLYHVCLVKFYPYIQAKMSSFVKPVPPVGRMGHLVFRASRVCLPYIRLCFNFLIACPWVFYKTLDSTPAGTRRSLSLFPSHWAQCLAHSRHWILLGWMYEQTQSGLWEGSKLAAFMII